MSAHRIAIIGAGVAGLAAAFSIQQTDPDAQVELFEASPRVGGAIGTERIGEYLIERGADMFATDPPAAMKLCEELGIADTLISPLPTARGAAIFHRGKLVRIPEGFVLMRPTRMLPMMTTPLLSIAGKIRLLCEPFISRREDKQDESIESFVVRRLGRETLERIVQPLVGGIYTGDVAALGMAATMAQFHEMERRDGSLFRATRRRNREGSDSVEQNSAGARYEKFRSFPGGMIQLIEALAARIDPKRLHLDTAVTALERETEGWVLSTHAGEQGPFDHVIVATPAKHASSMLSSVDEKLADELSSIRFASSVVVVVVAKKIDMDPTMDVAGFVVPIAEKRNVLAVSFTGDKFAGRTPSDERLMRVFIGGELQSELLSQSDDALVSLAIDELGSLIGLRGKPLLTKVVRWNDAMPQYHIGHLERLARIDALLVNHPGISLIGNSFHGVGIAPTIAHATKVARLVVESKFHPPAQRKGRTMSPGRANAPDPLRP